MMGIAEDRGYAQDAGRLQSVRYTHDAMIDMIIAEPGLSQAELARALGYTEPWVSRVIGSDSFQARLAERKGELVDPFLVASLEERLRGLAMHSLDVVSEKLRATQNPDLAMAALELSTKALGFGARQQNVANVNSFVVMLPEKAKSEGDWVREHNGGNQVIEGEKIMAEVVPGLDING